IAQAIIKAIRTTAEQRVYDINWSKKAQKDLSKIDRRDKEAIIDAVDTLQDLPTAKNVRHLTNHDYGYRLRVGHYRVLFDADDIVMIVEIQRVKKRDENTY